MSHVRPMGVPDDARVTPIQEPQSDIYEEAVAALLELVHSDQLSNEQKTLIQDAMISPLRGIRRRNQFLPLKDTGMSIDEDINHFKNQ